MSAATTGLAFSGTRSTRLGSLEPLDVVPRLLALLVIPTSGGWPTIAGVVGAAIVAATPGLMRSSALWLVIGTFRLATQFAAWHGIDDHEVLISYTCIAFGLALWSGDPARAARRSLPLLLGLTMAFATLWKLGAGQFLDGDTLRYTLLTDPRFELSTSWFAGVSDSTLAANDATVAALRDPAGSDSVTLVEPGALTVFAYLLTFGAIALEAALAAVYLSPRTARGRRAWFVAAFCLATYVIVPVSRFGLILCTCAYAGSQDRRDRTVLLSAAAFCVVWPPIWTALGGTQ